MSRKMLSPAAAVLLAIGAWDTSMAVDININTGTMYQTIEGFGAFATITPWKNKVGAFYVDVDLLAVGFYDSLVSELGATMWRYSVAPEFQDEPGVFNVGTLRGGFRHLQQLKAAAERQSEPVRFIGSVWSPPWWMKVSKCLSKSGNEVNPDGITCDQLNNTLDQALYLDDFAGHMSMWLKVARDTFSVPFYAVSLQNEPAFDEPYASCNYYNGNNYNSMFRVVAPLIHAEVPDVKLFGVEHMGWAFSSWEDVIRADATSAPHMHAWAIHGYYDGVQADTGSFLGSTNSDKPVWMSETSGSNYGVGISDWAGAMTLARNIVQYLRNGYISAWTWWSLQDMCDYGRPGCEATNPADYCLIINGTKTAKYYSSSHIYRFVRPGARQIQSTCSDGQLTIAAFRHAANNCVSIVIVNTGTASKTINVTGTGAPSSFELHVSTADTKRAVSSVGNSSITIPATCVATLVSGAYRGTEPVGVDQPGQARAAALPAVVKGARVTVYTLDGKLVPAGMVKQLKASSVVVERATMTDGRTVTKTVRVAR